MVVIVLKVKAELENVAKLIPPSQWCVTVKQSAGDETRGPVFIDPENEEEISGSRGTANFIIRFNKKESYINIVEKSKDVVEALVGGEEGNSDDYVALVAFECRGVEPVEWHLGPGFTIVSEGGHMFEDVDLAGGDCCEYDEENEMVVNVSDIEYKFEQVSAGKGKKKR